MRNISYINAGAGSGKTYSLTDIFANLIKDGKTTPSRVILTTFTERAAEEFRIKARAMLIDRGLHDRAAELDSALIGTVHSVAMRYISKYWYLLGLGAGVHAMPEEDTERYIAATLAGVATEDDIRVFGEYAEAADLRQSGTKKKDYDFWKADVRALIEKSETFGVTDIERSEKESLKLFSEIFSDADSGDAIRDLQKEVIRRVFRIARAWRSEYERYKREHDLVSFNDMERLFIRLLGIPQVSDDIRGSIDYVFVDEFQDSNPTQVRIFDTLSDIVSGGSFWVGDPKQAIYGFRGSDTALTAAVTSIIEEKAREDKPEFKFSVLPYSWRSDPYLVDLVNKAFVPVFKGVLTEDKVKLEAKRESILPPSPLPSIHWDLKGQLPEGAKRPSYKKEYLFAAIAGQISDILAGKGRISRVVDKDSGKLRPVKPSDIAVLCRKGEDCELQAWCLRQLGLPVTRERSCEDVPREVAIVIAVLNYFLGDTNLLDAELAYLLEDRAVEMILEDKEALGEMDLFKKLDGMKERLRGYPVPYVVSSIIRELDLESMVCKWDRGEERRFVLESVKKLAADYEGKCFRNSSAATIGGFVHFLSTAPVTVSMEIQEGGVNVLTYHASKGLEWPIVILCSLATDELDDQSFLKRNYIGVNERRLAAPTSDNLYSEYVIRYIPRFLSAANSNLPVDVADAIRDRADYREKRDMVRGEMARLLYVGATRARDYLITTATKASPAKWLANLGMDMACDYQSPEGNYCVWGPLAPVSFMEHIDVTGTPVPTADAKYSVLLEELNKEEHCPKYRHPSEQTGGDSKPDQSLFTSQVYPEEGETGERISVTGAISAYDLFGTCIHNIFAAYRPGEETWNLKVAERTVRKYGFQEILKAPSEIIRAADNLYAFLEKKYGKAKAVYHELPFSYLDEATREVISGEMDLVWETDRGVVLVDFKNYPGYDDVLNPASKFYVGKYIPQMSHYENALTRAGKTVVDSLIFYAVQGRIVKV